jgi:hypothetical protein
MLADRHRGLFNHADHLAVTTPRHHVGAAADPRRVTTNGRGGDAEFFDVIEPTNAEAA